MQTRRAISNSLDQQEMSPHLRTEKRSTLTFLTVLALALPALVMGWLVAACASSPNPDPAPTSPPQAEDDLEKMFAEAQRASQRMRGVIGPYREAGNLLGEMVQLRALVAEHEGAGGMVETMFAQVAGTTESFLGNHRAALETYDRLEEAPALEPDGQSSERPDLTDLRAEDAVEVLVRAARESRAVVINEAHHVARHRVLTRRLLPQLRELGFTHFAAEALKESDGGLAERGYPTAATGYYLGEPLYADLIREALALGYEVVAYEKPGPPAVREPGQAQNLAERIFADPDARALIHVGYSHNLESAESFGGAGAMAWHLRELTGIDPLTIDQTRMRERGRSELEDPLFRKLVETFALESPAILVDGDGLPWQPPGANRDFTVFSPPTRDHQGRPHWLYETGGRRALALPGNVCAPSESCVVEAHFADEGDDAVPIDRIEARSSDSVPILVIPKEPLRIRALGADLDLLKTWETPG